MLNVASRTATLPQSFSPANVDEDAVLVDEALRIAILTLQETATKLLQVSPGTFAAESLSRMAESMESLLLRRSLAE